MDADRITPPPYRIKPSLVRLVEIGFRLQLGTDDGTNVIEISKGLPIPIQIDGPLHGAEFPRMGEGPSLFKNTEYLTVDPSQTRKQTVNFGNDDAVSTLELGVTDANVGWSVAKELGVNRVTIQIHRTVWISAIQDQAGAESLGERTSRRVTEQLIAKPASYSKSRLPWWKQLLPWPLPNAHTIARRPHVVGSVRPSATTIPHSHQSARRRLPMVDAHVFKPAARGIASV